MHYVRRFEVDGLWGLGKKVELSFDRNVNFLIGKNGSGKTTLINMLAALLKADHSRLAKIDFAEATVHLQETPRGATTQIHAQRLRTKNSDGVRIRLKSGGGTEWLELKPKESDNGWYTNLNLRIRSRSSLEVISEETDVPEPIRNIINVYWLPLNRAGSERGGGSLIDSKLEDISSNIGSYLSSLDSKAARETKQFEEYVFLGLLASGEDRYNPLVDTLNIDVESEKAALTNIFRKFALSEKTFKERLDIHSDAVARALASKRARSGGGMAVSEYAALRDSVRIDALIKEWTLTQDKISKIYINKTNFTEIINTMFANKMMKIDERTRLVVNRCDGKAIQLESLSSGEKQLLILLGETLKQEEQASTYIADEPELSLHVDWQSQLVGNLLVLNKNMQIIFATHSPDIVANYTHNVIRVDEKTS